MKALLTQVFIPLHWFTAMLVLLTMGRVILSNLNANQENLVSTEVILASETAAITETENYLGTATALTATQNGLSIHNTQSVLASQTSVQLTDVEISRLTQAYLETQAASLNITQTAQNIQLTQLAQDLLLLNQAMTATAESLITPSPTITVTPSLIPTIQFSPTPTASLTPTATPPLEPCVVELRDGDANTQRVSLYDKPTTAAVETIVEERTNIQILTRLDNLPYYGVNHEGQFLWVYSYGALDEERGEIAACANDYLPNQSIGEVYQGYFASQYGILTNTPVDESNLPTGLIRLFDYTAQNVADWRYRYSFADNEPILFPEIRNINYPELLFEENNASQPAYLLTDSSREIVRDLVLAMSFRVRLEATTGYIAVRLRVPETDAAHYELRLYPNRNSRCELALIIRNPGSGADERQVFPVDSACGNNSSETQTIEGYLEVTYINDSLIVRIDEETVIGAETPLSLPPFADSAGNLVQEGRMDVLIEDADFYLRYIAGIGSR